MKFGVTVIYYNPEEAVLEQLKIYEKIFDNILIVDNSTALSHTIKNYLSDNKKITYKNMDGNKGMSAALNCAFEWAMAQKLDYILTMDQDSRYSAVDIRTMLHYIEGSNEDDVAIYVANFAKLYWDKKKNRMVAGKPCIGREEVKEVGMCLTSSSFVNVKAVQKILPLKDYFISYVDNFISTDLIKHGYRLVRVGASYFEQQVGERVKYSFLAEKLRVVHHKEERYYYMIRNNCYYRQKYKSDSQLKWRSYLLLWRLLFNIAIGEPQKWRKLKSCMKGYRDYRKGVYGKMP